MKILTKIDFFDVFDIFLPLKSIKLTLCNIQSQNIDIIELFDLKKPNFWQKLTSFTLKKQKNWLFLPKKNLKIDFSAS